MKPGAGRAWSPNHLKAWRLFAGWTQAQVEKTLHWPQSKVSHLERGDAVITDQILQDLARLYGCAPAALRSLPPPEPPEEDAVYPEPTVALYEAEQMLRKLVEEFQTALSATAAAMNSAVEVGAMLHRTMDILNRATARNRTKTAAEPSLEPTDANDRR